MTDTLYLLQKIDTLDGLTTDEKAQLKNLLNTTKKYGLIWEDKPEEVERQLLENLPVLVEVKERYIAASKPEPVEKVPTKKGVSEAQLSLGLETAVEDSENQSDAEEQNSEGPAPHHILIEGDNLHALTALSFTHKDKIDVIYIDPPYNTGNKDFKYNDTFVDKEDSYRHSKWLSFMHKRLVLAKQLLKETGVIFISIDDNEQSQLKLLCDEIFREENFLATICWKKKTNGNNMGEIPPVHDFILAYRKKEIDGLILGIPMSEEVIGKRYSNPDNDERGSWTVSDLSANHKGPYFEIINESTGQKWFPPDGRYWVFNEEEVKKRLLDGRIIFGKNGTGRPVQKKFLKERNSTTYKPETWWDGIALNNDGTKELAEILGASKVFAHPKPSKLIQHILRISAGRDMKVLDFFSGTGTTLHATMQLNAKDGGSRQCILVTNNENRIAEEVCYERNKRAIEGYVKPNGDQVGGLINNHLHYYKAAFVPAQRNQINRRQIVDAATEIICIRESAFTEVSTALSLETGFMRLFLSDEGQYTLVLYYQRYMDEAIAKAVELVQQLSIENGPVKVYAFAPQGERYEEEFETVKDRISVIPLPEAIYNAYQASLRRINVKRYRDNSFTEGGEPTDQTEINFTTAANG